MLIYDKECHACGAPSNGLTRCIWCGSAIRFQHVQDSTQTLSTNQGKTLESLRGGLSDAIDRLTGIKILG